MWTLAVDTSSKLTSLALKDSKGDLFEVSGEGGEELPALVRRILADASVSPQELERLIVGSGPGSFTGLRIGFGFMKGLAQALSVPLLKANSLMACASENRGEGKVRAALAYAGREEYFSVIYSFENGSYTELVPVGIRKLEEFLLLVKPDVPCVLAPGTELSNSKFEQSFFTSKHMARNLLELPFQAPGHFDLKEVAKLEPEYLRAVSALTIEERRSRGMLKNLS